MITPKHRKLIESSMKLDLPLPRLQLTWDENSNTKICYYDLILPCDTHDVRRESIRHKFVIVEMGKTNVTTPNPQNTETPYRDGVHIARDATTLHLPAYVVNKDKFLKLNDMPPLGQEKE